jgi:preprotein translocase subunit SecY
MFKTLQNAWKVKELRNRILITLALLAVYRAGVYITVPGVDTSQIKDMVENGLLFGFLDMLAGGSFKEFGIFALGISPYINSSIIFSLLQIAIPKLEAMSKEGEEGRKKIAAYTRYGTVVFAIINAFAISVYLNNQGMLKSSAWLSKPLQIGLIVITLTAGSTFVMWLGEKITEHGLGNGSSLIIFAGIVARYPSYVYRIQVLYKGESVNLLHIILLIAFALILVAGAVTMDLSERRIPVQYAQRKVGMRSYGGQSTHIPINLNSTGVIAIIFAMSLMSFPSTIMNLFSVSSSSKLYTLFDKGILSDKSWLYPILYVILILFFTWFYTSITFKPDEVAENLQKNGGFVPGLRPGKPTEEYITKTMNRMTLIGGIFASIIAVTPIIVGNYTVFGNNISLGGTSLLIVIGVVLELKRQLQSQLVMRHYEGFLK